MEALVAFVVPCRGGILDGVRHGGFCGRRMRVSESLRRGRGWRRSGPVMVFGPGGGFLGIGTPEVIVILAVGWIVLGPTEMIQLARRAGSLIGNLRSSAARARDELTQAIDLDEVQKEMRDVVDAVRDPVGMRSDFRRKENSNLEREEKEKAGGEAEESVERRAVTASVLAGDEGRETSSKFQDQLRRMEDPNQRSEWDVPTSKDPPNQNVEDLDSEEDELDQDIAEMEDLVKRYKELKKRKLQRKIQDLSEESRVEDSST